MEILAMSHNLSMFGLSYVIAIVVLVILGEFWFAFLAAFILFAGLRVAGH